MSKANITSSGLQRRHLLFASAAAATAAIALPGASVASETAETLKLGDSVNGMPLPSTLREKLFPGFKYQVIKTTGAEIATYVGGQGPALLLLHGHPQTSACWHKIAPELAKHFTVVMCDLRGYGDSSKPEGGKNHINYSKREMARDHVEVMRKLGFPRFQVAGHDRGARVLHRLLLDYPQAVERASMMDIAPTATMYAATDFKFAQAYVWWFFLTQPYPLPETLIGNNMEYYLHRHTDKQNKTPGAISPEVFSEYRRCYTKETLHAVCEEYRASASIDLEHDEADKEKRIQCPLLVIWGAKGTVGNSYDVLKTWRDKSVAGVVEGGSLPCGHYLPEEAPQETLAAFMKFFRTA